MKSLKDELFKNADAIAGKKPKVESETMEQPISIDELLETTPQMMEPSKVVEKPKGECVYTPVNVEDALGIKEMVDHPAHYNQGNIEVIKVIHDWGLGFNLGSTVKYLARAKYKGNSVEDVRKAVWYIQDCLTELDFYGTGMLYSAGAPHELSYKEVVKDWKLDSKVADVFLMLDMLRNMGIMQTANVPEVIRPILERMVLLCNEYITQLTDLEG